MSRDWIFSHSYRYYISNPESLANGELSRWLLDTYSTANTLSQSTSLKDRILVEEIPSSRHFLTDIVDAMKGNNIIMATYRNFHYKNSYTFPIAPYCLKMFQKRWYVLALSINEDRLRIYGLDRFENIEITKDHFKFPCDFNAKDYFSSFFGVVIDEWRKRSMPTQSRRFNPPTFEVKNGLETA